VRRSLQAPLKSILLKKHQNNITNFSNEFVINIKGELVRLQKGMSKYDVTQVLGEPFKIESCANKLNEKLVFKIYNGRPMSTRYSVLFFNEELVYVAKLT
jgi:phage terminase small subunit